MKYKTQIGLTVSFIENKVTSPRVKGHSSDHVASSYLHLETMEKSGHNQYRIKRAYLPGQTKKGPTFQCYRALAE